MLQERKYYFGGDNLYKVLHIFSAEGRAAVIFFDSLEPITISVDLDGAENVFEPAFRIGQVAKILKCHPDTIRKWEKDYITPIQQWKIGTRMQRFYSSEDIEMLQEVARTIHHGRPRKDGIIKNRYPSKGDVKQDIRERVRRLK